MSYYGKRLEEAMQAMRPPCTRATLAEKIGISVQSIGQVITGKTKMLDAVHHGLAWRYLGCSDQWLASGIGSMEMPKGDGMLSHSPEAQKLARWLDRIKDEQNHFRAYSAASHEILEILNQPDLPPTHKQDQDSTPGTNREEH